MKSNREPRPASEVMADIAAQMPALVGRFHMDRDWLWYCGPSLAGDNNKATRENLSALGFRYAPRGHTMQDGVTVGSWSHSCEAPRGRMFRKGQRNNSQHNTTNNYDEPAFDPIGALAALGV